jgi:hypothetical protein
MKNNLTSFWRHVLNAILTRRPQEYLRFVFMVGLFGNAFCCEDYKHQSTYRGGGAVAQIKVLPKICSERLRTSREISARVQTNSNYC